MDISFRGRSLVLAGAFAGQAISGAAVAQPEDTTKIIEEVVVTAQKRSQSVQEVPVSMTALNSETLQQLGVTDATDLQFIVPSMQVGGLVGNTSINIRGVGLNLVVANGSPGVAVHVDGVYQPNSAMGNLAQTDLERIEVLRGPQGTLYGRNATGGAVNFITQAPTHEFEGHFQAGYAEYDESQVQGVINVPISDRVQARAVVDWTKRRDGFVKNIFPDGQDVIKSDTVSGRLRLTADLTADLALDITGGFVDTTGPLYAYTLRNQPVEELVAVNPWLADVVLPEKPWRTSINNRVDLDRKYRFASATLTWEIGELQAKSITGYQHLKDDTLGDDDGSNVNAFPPNRVYDTKTITQEFNVSGAIGPVDTVVGLFYMDDDYDSLIDFSFPLGVSILPPFSRQVFQQMPLNTESVAIFGDATWNVTQRFRLIGGIRFSEDSLTNSQENYLRFGPTAPPLFVCPLQTNKAEFDSTTWRTGAQLDVSEASNLYATVSTGFKAGGFNRNTCGQTYKPEEITAYEIGSKNLFFNNTVALNASAFFYDYTDLQLSQQVDIAQQITNAAEAEVKGLELEGRWQPDDHWTVYANVTFLDATFTDFLNVDALMPSLGVQDVSGNHLYAAPEQAANIGVSYRTGDLGFGNITFRADASQRTKYYFAEFNEALDRQDGFTMVDLAMIWDSPSETYRVRLYAENVTDEAIIAWQATVNSLGSRIMTWAAPRQIGLELRAKL